MRSSLCIASAFAGLALLSPGAWAQNPPARQAPAQQAPAQKAPSQKAPARNAPAQQAPRQQQPQQQRPAARQQAPAPPAFSPHAPPPPTQTRVEGDQRRTAYRPVVQAQYVAQPYGTPGYQYHPGNRSVLRQSRYGGGYNENTYGVRNPGGVGRYAEYYPPNDVFQNGGHDPTARAGFDQNIPVGSIQEQAMAQQVGNQKYATFQQHLDNFARPLGFYGFGGWGVGGPF